MFNLFRSGAKAHKYMLGALMLILAASMLTYLTNTGLTTTGTTDTVVANVAGQQVLVTEVQAGLDRMMRSGQLPPDAADVYVPQYVEQMISQKALLHASQGLGIKVSDDEVLLGMMSAFPQFFENGKLTSKDNFEQALAQQGLTMQDAVDGMREQLTIRKLQSVALSSVVVTPQEIDQAILLKHEKATLEYIAFPGAKFRDQAKVTPEEVRAAYDKNQSSYIVPEKRNFQVVLIDQMKIEQSISVSDAQLKAAYSASMDNYRIPERVEARHILLMTQGKSDADKKTALTKAQDLLKKIKGGADFAKLAMENSEDPGSGQKGGDLGFIVRGQTVPEFEKFIFSAKPKDLSDIVTTQYGYHIIQVMSKEAARIKPFEEVKASIADELKKQGVNEKLQMIADQAHAAIEKAPATAADVAKQFGLDVLNITDSKAGDTIAGLGNVPEIDNAIAAMKPNEVSPALFLPANRIAIVVFKNRVAARPAQFADVEAAVRDRLIQGKADELAMDAAKKAAARLKAGENADQVAKSMGLTATKSANFTRNDSVEGLGPANFVKDSFENPAGTVLGPVSIQGRNIVYKITERQTPDLKEYASERDSMTAELKQQKAQTEFSLLLDSIVSKLRADGEVTTNDETLKRIAGAYRQNR